MKKLVLLSVAFFSIATLSHSLIIEVPLDYPTIQTAIQNAASGDTVLVAKGTYNESISFEGKNIVVASHFLTTGDSLCIDETIIRAITGSVVTFQNNETKDARLVGFTIKNGSGTKEGITRYGGGIYCSLAHPTLEHLKVIENTLAGLGGCGGGMYFRESNAHVINCRIEDNESPYGGGIRCDGADIKVTGTWFRNNFSVASGGGMMFVGCPAPRIEQCTFTGNSGTYGGAIACNNSSPVIDRVTSFHNIGGYGGTLNVEGNSNPKVINSIFWENSSNPSIVNEIFLGPGYNTLLVAYCDILGSDTAIHNQGSGTFDWMEGNIEIYPEFNNPVAMDLTLSESSPCVDAGIDLFIYFGDTLVNISSYSGVAPDMGAHEYEIPLSSDPGPLTEQQSDFQIQTRLNSGTVVVHFTLPESLQVQLSLYDLRGREICSSRNQRLSAGEHAITLNPSSFNSGIYIVQLIAGGNSASRKVLVN
ncbi:T9SS type A sorting domain-containing protein [Bacteroidota bacterium]